MNHYHHVIPSPLGQLLAISEQEALYSLSFIDEEEPLKGLHTTNSLTKPLANIEQELLSELQTLAMVDHLLSD